MDPVSFQIQLQNIHCFDEADSIGAAQPYLWAVFFKVDGDSTFVDETFHLQGTAQVFGTLGDHGNLDIRDVSAGDDVTIPGQFGFGDVLRAIPLRKPANGENERPGTVGCAVVLMEQDNTPDGAIAAGHAALNIHVQSELNNLIPTLTVGHEEPTPEEIEEIKKRVEEAVFAAIKSHLGLLDEISSGFNDDDFIGAEVFTFKQDQLLNSDLAGIPFDVRFQNEGDWQIFGNILRPGRPLLFYRDQTQNGTGNVANPSVIGLGGWQQFKSLFSGGNGIVYAVDPHGRLLFYRDTTQNGTGNVANPSIIGLGGWDQFKFLFSGGSGTIYAVDSDGRLLFYRDTTQNGTGDVANPSVISQGGWDQFRFLFSGGNGIIYAVDSDGRLLFYRDQTQNGTGKVVGPSVIGLGGWQQFQFLFSGGNGIIYAVDPAGRLLFYRDHTKDGTGNVANPSVIGLGGWQNFRLLFSGGNGNIYAVPV